MEIESIQAAYTVGGLSFKVARSEVDNGKYTAGTGNDKEATTMAVSLAF